MDRVVSNLEAPRSTSVKRALDRRDKPVNSTHRYRRARGTHHGPIEIVLTPSRRRLLPDTAGAVAVEYTMLLIFVALPLAAALAAGGVVMLNEYRVARDLILLPVP